VQSHYPRPSSLSTNLPSGASTTAADPTSHNAPSGMQMPPPPFQENLPPYRPGSSLPTWNSSPMPSSANGTGLTMPPMYWPGYYPPPSGFPHLQPPPFLRPLGLTVPQALQPPVQYPGLNGPLPAGLPNMPELPSFLQPGNNNRPQSLSVSASISVPVSSSTQEIESLGSQVPNKLSSCLSAVVSVGQSTPTSVESIESLSQGTPAHVNTKPASVPASSLLSLSNEKPVSVAASMPTYLPPSQPPSANVRPVTLATPGAVVPTSSSAALLSHTLQISAAVVPSSKTSSSTVLSSQATSSTVPSSQATSTIVPFSQATSPVHAPSENASSPFPRKQLMARSENKETKQREWKAKQSAVAQSNKEPLLPAPKPASQKVVVY
jgi:protein LSM14